MITPLPIQIKLPDLGSLRIRSKKTHHTALSNSLEHQDNDSVTLFEIKQQRKIIENDARILANRLKVLKLEEAKILKNVEELQKKTLDIIEQKAQKELQLVVNSQSMSVDKIQPITEEEEEKHKRKKFEIHNTSRQQLRIKGSVDFLHKIKELEIKKLKEQLKKDHGFRKSIDEHEYEIRLNRNLKVKAEESTALKKKKEYMLDKIEKIKDSKHYEISEELDTIQNLKKELKNLTKEEDEVIDNINQANNLKYELFEKFNEAKLMPSDEALEKLSKSNTSILKSNLSSRHLSLNRSVSSSVISDESAILGLPKMIRKPILSPLKPISSKDLLSKPIEEQEHELPRHQTPSSAKKIFLDIDYLKKIYKNARKAVKTNQKQ